MESTRSRDTKAPSAWTTFFLTQSAEHAQPNNGPYAHTRTPNIVGLELSAVRYQGAKSPVT